MAGLDFFDFLVAPGIELSFAELPQFWRYDTITFHCDRPALLEGGAWLAGAFRGALGRQIYGLADQGVTGAGLLRFAFEESLGIYNVNQQVPRPYVIEIDAAPDALTIKVILFGEAGIFHDLIAQAGKAALERGLPLRERGRTWVPYPLKEVVWNRQAFVPVKGEGQTRTFVEFLTPVHISRAHSKLGPGETLFLNMATRLAGVARWMDGYVDPAHDTWRKLLADVSVSFSTPDGPVVWERHSINKGDDAIPMLGWTGSMEIEGVLGPLATLLSLSEVAHIGGQTAFGFGRIRAFPARY